MTRNNTTKSPGKRPADPMANEELPPKPDCKSEGDGECHVDPNHPPVEQISTSAPPAPLGITAPDPPPAKQPPAAPPVIEQAKALANEEPKQQPLAPQSDKPVCPYCKVSCRSNRSEPYFTRYYCPERGCTYSVKVPRPRMQERLASDRQAEQGGFIAR